MGGTISVGSSSLNERKRRQKLENASKRRQEEDDARRRRLLEQYGVLIPPVFLANKTDNPPLSSRAWERVFRESTSLPGDRPFQQNGSSGLLSWAYRRKRPTDTNATTSDDGDDNLDLDAGPLLGQTLLTEYMAPGLFLSLPVAASRASKNDGGRFVAAVTPQAFSSSDNGCSLPSFLSLTKRFDRDSFLLFPFPLKIETFLPQHSLLSQATPLSHGSDTGILPSSMRVTAELSSPNNKNQNRISWTTHFFDQNQGGDIPSSTMVSSYPVWNKFQGSWIEAETVRPNWLNTDISLRLASSMTVNCLLDKIVLEACRYGNDIYQEYNALESTKDTFGNFLRESRKQISSNLQEETMQFRFAAEYKESIIASNTNVSMSSLFGMGATPAVTYTDTLFSVNLNGGGGTIDQQHPSPPPPLWLTLQQSKSYNNSSWLLNLSQVVSFDREIWNILEDRAPNVRNHVGWVCQIERFKNHESSDGNISSSPKSSTSILSVGASAQFNRNIAAKAILESKIGAPFASSSPLSSSPTATSPGSAASSKPTVALKFAFVFKRWLEPRASLSIIQSIDLFTGKLSFLGLGLEIEQGQHFGTAPAPTQRRTDRKANRGAEYRDTTDTASSVAPPTRVEVGVPGTGKK